jgi:NodT family efflux transporter outer membrane factor (OMF) lipoprotein
MLQQNKNRRHSSLGVAAAVAAATILSGCMLGPDFQRPAAPDVTGYTPEPHPAPTVSSEIDAGEAQKFVMGADIPGEWWTLFHSEPLNSLVNQALKANPNLQAAQAALRQAQENVAAQQGALFPTVIGDASVTPQTISGARLGAPGKNSEFTLYNASVNVSYTPDVFGGIRREIESVEAQAEFEQFQLEASYLTITSNVVTAAVQEASLRGQIDATQDIIDIESQQLDVLRDQLALGGTTRAAVLAQEAVLAQTRATLPPLQKQLAQQRDLLAALAGRFPSQEPAETFRLSTMHLPQDLPLSLPSQLVEQRPDVRALEAQLHSASAQIGVATANQFPQFAITASYGRVATQIGQLFAAGAGVWSVGGSVAQTIFDADTLYHKKRAAIAAFDQAAAQYRATVLLAFQNVADSLRALQSDAELLKAQVAAERSAADNLDISQRQFQAGAIPYVTLLNAQQTYQQARIGLVQAQASRFADTAALFQALGGGWWHRTDVATGTAQGGQATE